ncbi:MAG: MarR family transcriptional regulator [Alphaproteobacteria bacterium]|nr:MarR family transcriptional regulator [Alphaproteobacteria bacterium]|tara:strand:- start:344 stop:1324 length:981 start_codon:yes stop_codon:yes gene_type:complete
MPSVSKILIRDIHRASREMVRELGFMNRTLAGTDMSASAVHAMVEIGVAGRIPAKVLAEKLLLEKSTVSRLVRSLVNRGEVREVRSQDDGRSKFLSLTFQGERTLKGITGFAEQQVTAVIGPLGSESRQGVVKGLQVYVEGLRAARLGEGDFVSDVGPKVCEGYAPTLIGRVVEMHATFYSRWAKFGPEFEAKVASEMAQFVTRLGSPKNQIWHVMDNGRVVAGIAVDGEDLGGDKAHLRWFIVDDGQRGAGLGKLLMNRAMSFCDAHYFAEVHLWTLKGLDAARTLYEQHGFSLTEEYRGDQWGATIEEQKFVRSNRSRSTNMYH